MSNNNVNRRNEESSQLPANWDWPIDDAKNRIKKLRGAIRVFEKMRDQGEPWRGDVDVSKLSVG
jgi:hypothetical protein